MVTWWPKNHLDLPASISAGAHLQALEMKKIQRSSMIVKEKMYENTHLEAGWILRFFPVKNGGHWNKLMLLGERSPHNQKKTHGDWWVAPLFFVRGFFVVTPHPGVLSPPRIHQKAGLQWRFTGFRNQKGTREPFPITMATNQTWKISTYQNNCQVFLGYCRSFELPWCYCWFNKIQRLNMSKHSLSSVQFTIGDFCCSHHS